MPAQGEPPAARACYTQPMIFLSAIERCAPAEPADRFPWSLAVLRELQALRFAAPVTFLVGENGSGKSTLLEGLAAGIGAVAAGSRDIERDESLHGVRKFARAFRFARRRHPRVKLFLRAEDVFGFTQRVAHEIAGLEELEEEFRGKLPDSSYGRRLATGLVAGQRRALAVRYGDDPLARSHGETFLRILQERLTPNGLYLLDEPETPLSPSRVLSLLALLKDRVQHDCQFVIATHSPLLLALPGAEILLLEGDRIQPTAYDELEHVRLTRAFLANPERFLRHL
jgi:predicted ATPase